MTELQRLRDLLDKTEQAYSLMESVYESLVDGVVDYFGSALCPIAKVAGNLKQYLAMAENDAMENR